MENQKTQGQLEIERIFNRFYTKLECIAKDLDETYSPLLGKGSNNSVANHLERSADIFNQGGQESQNILGEAGYAHLSSADY